MRKARPWRRRLRRRPPRQANHTIIQSRITGEPPVMNAAASTNPQAVPIATQLGEWIGSFDDRTLNTAIPHTTRMLLLDVLGLCIAARHEDYIRATLAACDSGGACTALGHAGSFSAFDAALINGTAAHGEDYDDTFEG